MMATDNTVLCEPRLWSESAAPRHRRIPIRVHCITSRKAAFFTVTDDITSDVTESVTFSIIVKTGNTDSVGVPALSSG